MQPVAGDGEGVELQVGDRVRLKQSLAGRFIDPKIDRRARAGRAATITSIIGTDTPEARRTFWLEFDTVGRERPLRTTFDFHDIERCPAVSSDV